MQHLWEHNDSKNWKRADNEVESAKKLLEELANEVLEGKVSSKVIDEVSLTQEEGHIAFAFGLPGHLQQWSSRIREISIDSACKI